MKSAGAMAQAAGRRARVAEGSTPPSKRQKVQDDEDDDDEPAAIGKGFDDDVMVI